MVNRGRGCRMCDKGTRTGLPYVQRGIADGVAVCAMKERSCASSRDVRSVRVLGSEPGPECSVSWFGEVTW